MKVELQHLEEGGETLFGNRKSQVSSRPYLSKLPFSPSMDSLIKSSRRTLLAHYVWYTICNVSWSNYFIRQYYRNK